MELNKEILLVLNDETINFTEKYFDGATIYIETWESYMISEYLQYWINDSSFVVI